MGLGVGISTIKEPVAYKALLFNKKLSLVQAKKEFESEKFMTNNHLIKLTVDECIFDDNIQPG
ncbi:MAG: hypothetical protein DWQ05_19410 [Calditrichaeota bacterium]|nr:MAG: hypothetical protein DWQ05_19410 [Calditrichota bacterium]